jgi:hypothetical protein
MQPTEEGDDDGGEAVARRDDGTSWPMGPATSKRPARPAQAPPNIKVSQMIRSG